MKSSNFDRILEFIEEKSTYKISVYRFDKTLVITKNKQGTRNLDLYLRYYISQELLSDYADKEQIYQVIQTLGESLIREYHFAPASGINKPSITLDDLQGFSQRKEAVTALSISAASRDLIMSTIEKYMVDTELELEKLIDGESDYNIIFCYRDPIKRVVSGVAQDVISIQMDTLESKIILRAALDIQNNHENKILYDSLYKPRYNKVEEDNAVPGLFHSLVNKLPENAPDNVRFLYKLKSDFFKKITKEYMAEMKFENQHSGAYLYALWPLFSSMSNVHLLNLDAKNGGTIDIHSLIDKIEEKDRAMYVVGDAVDDKTIKKTNGDSKKKRDAIYKTIHKTQKNDGLKDLVIDVIGSLEPTEALSTSFTSLISKELIHYNTMKFDSRNMVEFQDQPDDLL